jgi:hypothetical protein
MCPACVRTLLTSALPVMGVIAGSTSVVIGKIRVKKTQPKENKNGQ